MESATKLTVKCQSLVVFVGAADAIFVMVHEHIS